MKTRMILVTLVVCLAAAAANADDNPFMGTWKLNLLKSKILNQDGIRRVPLTKSTVTYELVRNQVKVTDDDTFTDGHSMHMEWIGKFDGKDYPVTGDPTADTWSYKKLNDHTLIFTTKKDGKIQAIRHMTVSADGKTRTSTGTRTDASGKTASVTAIYEKD
jgi:predicted nucleic acid-binding protein